MHIETRDPITVDMYVSCLRDAPGVTLMDERVDGGYPTAVLQGTGTDPVYVGRIRKDISHERGSQTCGSFPTIA